MAGEALAQGHSVSMHLDLNLTFSVCSLDSCTITTLCCLTLQGPVLHLLRVIHRTYLCWELGKGIGRENTLSLFYLDPTESSWSSKESLCHPGFHLLHFLLPPLP